jgi:hypothetical protein
VQRIELDIDLDLWANVGDVRRLIALNSAIGAIYPGRRAWQAPGAWRNFLIAFPGLQSFARE